MTGDADFSEVFLDNVRVPAQNIVGQRGQGWVVSRSTLKHERALIGNASLQRRTFDGLAMLAQAVEQRGQPASKDPVLRDRLVAARGAAASRSSYNGYRLLTASARGEDPGLAGMVTKLYSTQLGYDIAKLAMDVMGDRGAARPRRAERARHGHVRHRVHVVARHPDRRRRRQHPAQHHRRARSRPAARRAQVDRTR